MSLRVARDWSPRSACDEAVRRLREEGGVSARLARLLVSRGVDRPEDAVRFLEPGWDDLHDPFLIPGMAAACEAVHAAVAAGETVTLYGDYDVDGTCATALLYWVFKKLKAPVRVHVPDRKDGYGLCRAGIDAAAAAGSKFIVTMDQGISALDEIAYAASLGVRVLVTDHHAPPETVPPEAVAILHPYWKAGYPNPGLCGAAMAFKFGEALLKTAANPALKAAARGYVENCIDLAAIATIADVSPLRGENRAIVALGLSQLGRTRHPGLEAMLRVAKRNARRPTVADVSFGVAPMMNAAGRLAGPELTLECLLTRSKPEAKRLARELAAVNQRRRDMTEDLMDLALEQAAGWADERIGVIRLDSDATGIVGLVAGRLKEMFWKPFVVLANHGDKLTGSCRSVEGFDVRAALAAVGEKLEKFGGHPMAAGLTMDPARFDEVVADLRAYARREVTDEHLVASLPVDEVLGVDEVTWELVDEVARLRPYGAGNPAPVFVLEGCEVARVKVMGKQGKHIRLTGEGFPEHLDPVGFHLRGTYDASTKECRRLDMAFQVDADEWMGRKRIQMRLEDLRPAPG